MFPHGDKLDRDSSADKSSTECKINIMENIELKRVSSRSSVFSIETGPHPEQASAETPQQTPIPSSRRFTSPFIDEAAACKVRSRFFKDYTHFIRGLRVEYLGQVPMDADKIPNTEHVSYCVEKLLDKCNMIESLVKSVFLEIDSRACALAMYDVDESARITHTQLFQLTRMPFCSSSRVDPKLFAWVYRREADGGRHQLECHAVRCENARRMNIIARKLYAAFNQLSSPAQHKVVGPCAHMAPCQTAQPLPQRY